MKVGLIGVGRMGAGMAGNLLKAGHEITVYNRTPAKAQALAEQGAQIARSVADAARGDVILTMLADDTAVEHVTFAKAGIIESLPRGALHICSSTISVALSAKLAEQHAAAGQRFVAAPVLGRPDAAAAGRLFVLAAGEREALNAAAPILEAIGQRTFVVSETPRVASLVKLSCNFLIASMIESLGESLALVAKAGVDREQYVELVTATLFNCPLYKNYGALIAHERFEPAGFTAPLGHKDIRLTLEAAETLRVPLPFASVLRDRLLALLAQGGEHLDWSAISRLASTDAGSASR